MPGASGVIHYSAFARKPAQWDGIAAIPGVITSMGSAKVGSSAAVSLGVIFDGEKDVLTAPVYLVSASQLSGLSVTSVLPSTARPLPASMSSARRAFRSIMDGLGKGENPFDTSSRRPKRTVPEPTPAPPPPPPHGGEDAHGGNSDDDNGKGGTSDDKEADEPPCPFAAKAAAKAAKGPGKKPPVRRNQLRIVHAGSSWNHIRKLSASELEQELKHYKLAISGTRDDRNIRLADHLGVKKRPAPVGAIAAAAAANTKKADKERTGDDDDPMGVPEERDARKPSPPSKRNSLMGRKRLL